MPVSLELILIGAALLTIGMVRLKGEKWGWFNRSTPASIAKLGPKEAAPFDWKGLSMAIAGGVALALGLALAGIDMLNDLFTWLKS